MSVAIFDELTRAELRGLTGSLVVIPIGATEQHGDGLPVMTDSAIVTHLAARAGAIAGEATNVLLAPTVRVGVSGHHLPFGGTLTVTSDTFIHLLVDLGVGLRVQGFSRLLFLNGHGGNDAAMRVAVEKLASSARPGESASGISYWTAAGDIPVSRFPTPGHAGGFETSAMLAIRPDLVAAPRAGALELRSLATDVVDGVHDVRPDVWLESDGVTDNAAGARAGDGEATLELIARRVAQIMIDQMAHLDDRNARAATARPSTNGEKS